MYRMRRGKGINEPQGEGINACISFAMMNIRLMLYNNFSQKYNVTQCLDLINK